MFELDFSLAPSSSPAALQAFISPAPPLGSEPSGDSSRSSSWFTEPELITPRGSVSAPDAHAHAHANAHAYGDVKIDGAYITGKAHVVETGSISSYEHALDSDTEGRQSFKKIGGLKRSSRPEGGRMRAKSSSSPSSWLPPAMETPGAMRAEEVEARATIASGHLEVARGVDGTSRPGVMDKAGEEQFEDAEAKSDFESEPLDQMVDGPKRVESRSRSSSTSIQSTGGSRAFTSSRRLMSGLQRLSIQLRPPPPTSGHQRSFTAPDDPPSRSPPETQARAASPKAPAPSLSGLPSVAVHAKVQEVEPSPGLPITHTLGRSPLLGCGGPVRFAAYLPPTRARYHELAAERKDKHHAAWYEHLPGDPYRADEGPPRDAEPEPMPPSAPALPPTLLGLIGIPPLWADGELEHAINDAKSGSNRPSLFTPLPGLPRSPLLHSVRDPPQSPVSDFTLPSPARSPRMALRPRITSLDGRASPIPPSLLITPKTLDKPPRDISPIEGASPSDPWPVSLKGSRSGRDDADVGVGRARSKSGRWRRPSGMVDLSGLRPTGTADQRRHPARVVSEGGGWPAQRYEHVDTPCDFGQEGKAEADDVRGGEFSPYFA